MSREIDSEVAVKIMGSICKCEKDPSGWSIHGYGSSTGTCWNCNKVHTPAFYSTDIAAAFDVVNHLQSEPNTIWQFQSYSNGHWKASVIRGRNERDMRSFNNVADNLPLAICLAALKATEEQPHE
jgi:hypothetical protein